MRNKILQVWVIIVALLLVLPITACKPAIETPEVRKTAENTISTTLMQETTQPDIFNKDDFFVFIDPEGIQDDAIASLNSDSEEVFLKKIAEIRENPENFIPPIFFMLSQIYLTSENYENAAFYYYFAQLRTRYDVNRCADPNAGVAADILSRSGSEINVYAFQDLDRLETIVLSVVEYDRQTEHNYDPRWLNGFIPTEIIEITDPDKMSLPKNEWATIEEATREEYLSEFYEALEEAKAMQENQ